MTPRYLADKSALARTRVAIVGDRLTRLIRNGHVATCAIIDLEVLYSARNLAYYQATRARRHALVDVPITPQVMSRALAVQHRLARTGHHRVAIADLIIAAAAESADLAVLHYDADFERIATVTGQPHEWVVPRGFL